MGARSMNCGIYPLLGRQPRRLSPPKWVRQLSLRRGQNLIVRARRGRDPPRTQVRTQKYII